MAQNNAALELIDLLATRNFDPEIFDIKTGNAPVNDKGKPDNSQGNQFLFHFIGDSGEDYGTVEIVLADGVMTVGSGNNTGRSMTNPQDKNSWFDFLLQLKKFAVRHDFNNFQVDNISRMKYLKQSIAQLTESFQGRGQYSWSGQPTEARMLIKHSRKLAETDARFRHIDSIFLETADGERYRLPTRSLSHGRAMLEHIRAGGRPWDARGAHINHIVEQLQILSRFRRAHQGRLFEGDAADLVNETNNYFGSLRKNLKSLATKSGYSKYFESWQPDAVNESELVVEDLRDLFVETRIDPRIEQALPLLAKIKEHNMKEADIFEAWANRLIEDTWKLPDTEEKMTKLKLFLSQPQAVGADADNATAALGDILGDTNLFDQLEALANTDPDADARPVVQAWLKANQNYPEIMAIVRELEQEPDVDQEISMTAQDMPDAEDNVREGDNLANPLEEVHSPGAMAMFPEEQGVAEGYDDEDEGNPVMNAIIGRIMRTRPDLLDYDMQKLQAAIRDVALDVGDVDEIGSSDINGWVKQVEQNLSGVSEGTEFGAYYYEQLAQKVFKANPNLQDENAILKAGYDIAKKELGARANGIFRDEDFFSDFVSAYGYLKKNHLDEGSCNKTMEGEYCPEHGLTECGYMESVDDPINYNAAVTGSYYESDELARIKKLALLK